MLVDQHLPMLGRRRRCHQCRRAAGAVAVATGAAAATVPGTITTATAFPLRPAGGSRHPASHCSAPVPHSSTVTNIAALAAPSPRASASYTVSGDNSLGMVLLKVLGGLAGVGGFFFGAVGFYARRKSMREQKVLLEDARRQQQQMADQFGLILSALDSGGRGKKEIEMQNPPSTRGEADATDKHVEQGYM